MAKKTETGFTKAQAIRDYLANNPGAMPRATVDALAKEGVIVTTQDVSVAKHKLKTAGGMAAGPAVKQQAETRPSGEKRTTKAPDGKITFAELRQAKDMARQLGGVDQAKKALEALAELTG